MTVGVGSDRAGWSTPGEAVSFCLQRPQLHRTLVVAAVVGVLLSVVNQLDAFIEGAATTATWFRVAANFVIPFVVTNVGALTSSHVARAEDG